MMLTVGRHYHGPSRNWNAYCDICGSLWPRHKLVLDRDQLLRCRDCWDERSKIELTELAADGASEATTVRGATRER
jgi:ribosome-binding protein aMBF1 (putative translation factor)